MYPLCFTYPTYIHYTTWVIGRSKVELIWEPPGIEPGVHWISHQNLQFEIQILLERDY